MALRQGTISAGHARALLTHPTPEAALRDVIDRQLSVRQTEALAARRLPEPTSLESSRRNQGPDTAALERNLSEQLGLSVKITFNGRHGVMQIHYTDLDQLDNLLSRLGLQQ